MAMLGFVRHALRLSRRSRNQKGVRRLSNNQPRLSRAVLDDPPIHIRPNCSRQSGCKGKNPLDSSHDGPTILPKNISAATPICAKNITSSVRKGLTEHVQGQLALLVRFQWVAGKRASALMSAGPFAAVVSLTRRIHWFEEGANVNISQHHHAWVVFDHAHPVGQPPALLFAD